MKNPNTPSDSESILVNKVLFTHKDIYSVVDDFYTRIQLDPLLQIPFRSVEDWPEHIERLTHFWWIRFGGKPYLFSEYNPVAKHFFAGFNQELLTRWLALFNDTLKSHLNVDQIRIWKLVSEKIGESLSLKNEAFKADYEKRIPGSTD